MNLEYKLLWIENEEDWLESVEEDIQPIVEEEYGFKYNRYNCKQEEEGINYNDYDLILMDLNLDGLPTGDQLIKKIRDTDVYTDVVFYSSGGLDTIKQKARDLDLEGVYFSGRNKTLFIEKVKKIIETTIKKTQDLNNLRGLVMAEVCELDAKMDHIIVKYFSTPKKMDIFHLKVTKNREKSILKSLTHPDSDAVVCDKKCQLNLRKMPIESIIKIIDSSQKVHALNEILKDINSDGHIVEVGDKFVQNYVDEIISVRNNLAHCESKIIDGIEVLSTRNGDLSFSASDFKRIRKNISKYNSLLCKLSSD